MKLSFMKNRLVAMKSSSAINNQKTHGFWSIRALPLRVRGTSYNIVQWCRAWLFCEAKGRAERSGLWVKSTLLLTTLFAVAAPMNLFGWGGGHDHVNRLALTVMPLEIRSFLGEDNAEKFVKWSHSPDDFTPWAELKQVTICAEDMQVLESQNMKHPYSLHSHKGHAINFILLMKAFRAQDSQRAAFWMSCLMHTVADELACNHDPLIHFMTYGFQSYGMEMGDGIGVDFADVARTKEGDTVIKEILKGVKVVPVSSDPQTALLKVMMSGIEGNAYMTERGSRIAASYAQGASDAVRKESIKAMAELGVQGVQESLNVIVTAWDFAKQKKLPELNEDVEKRYNLAAAEFGRKRSLRQDSLFTDLLNETTDTKPFFGVLVEPSISMNKAKLGFSSKYISAAIVRTLRRKNKTCRLLDIREVDKSGFASASEMPLLIISAGGFHTSKELKAKLAAYMQGGGKLLWIGGDHKNQLGDLSKSMVRAESDQMPVSNKYGKDSPAREKAVIKFCPEFAKSLGSRGYKFVRNPNTKAGWQKPICNFYIKDGDEKIVPLAEMTVDQSVMTVAAACKNKEGVFQYLFLPEFLVSPYLLSDETSIKDPSLPILDSVGAKVLMSSVDVLMRAFPATKLERPTSNIEHPTSNDR